MRLLALTFLALLLIPATASAKPRTMSYEYAAIVALDFWETRGVDIPCRPTYRIMNPKEIKQANEYFGYPIDMQATRTNTTCTIEATPTANQYRTSEPWYFCAEIAHEYGHIGGLDHFGNGLMSEDGIGEAPWGCKHRRKFMRKWNQTR